MHRWILAALLLLPLPAAAQMVRGTVTDAGTSAPIKAANISLFTTEGRRVGKVVSDQDGKFEAVLPKGKAVYLEADRIGYQKVRSDTIHASTSEVLELDVRLSAAAVLIQGIQVTTRRQVEPRLQPFLDRASLYKRAGIGHIWTRKELERRPLALTSQLLGWVHQRSVGACSGLSVFIDDMPVEAQDMDLLVAPEELEGVELYDEFDVPPDLVYRSRLLLPGFGALLPPCRTMMLWRKPYAELNAIYAAHPVKTWRTILGAIGLGMILLVEYSL